MKPILFNSEMVRAILDGRKTQTLRPIKPQPTIKEGVGRWMQSIKNQAVGSLEYIIKHIEKNSRYKKGDVLYVREAFGIPIAIMGNVIYRADYEEKALLADGEKWHPSIHMPRKLARIFIQITDVKVYYLQDISDAEAIAEGVKTKGDNFWYDYNSKDYRCAYPKSSFKSLWQQIYGNNTLYSWEQNPLVLSYEFRIVE